WGLPIAATCATIRAPPLPGRGDPTMPGADTFVQEPATTDVAAAEPDSRYLRLSSCPRCAGRRRALVEVGNRLIGRCLGCGEELSVPLETEVHSHILIVGRAGQGVFTVDYTGD